MKENIVSLSKPENKLNIEIFFNCFELQFESKTLNKFSELINSGYTPLIVSNHQSHADGLPLSLLTKEIKEKTGEKLNGFYLPIAASMVNGDQDQELKSYLEKLSPACFEKGLEMIPVTRKKDEEVYNIKDKNFDSLKKILSAHKQGYGIIFLPEGSVKAGRSGTDGEITGMIDVGKDNSFDGTIKKYLSKNIKFCVLPVAIDGSYKLYNPDTKKITIPNNKITLTISNEILLPSDFKNKSLEPTDLVMPQIAQMLPIKARGIYR